MDRSRATHFTQDEQILIMQGCEEFNETIMAKSNYVAANIAREGCWQKSADRVNAKVNNDEYYDQYYIKPNIILSP